MKKIFLFIFLLVSGCGTLDRALDIYEYSIQEKSAIETITQKENNTLFEIDKPKNLTIEKIDKNSFILKWEATEKSKKFIIYRAWSYPQYIESYKKVGESINKTFYIENVNLSDIHYYVIQSIIDNEEGQFSNYVIYSPSN